jgi:hypothetical protein
VLEGSTVQVDFTVRTVLYSDTAFYKQSKNQNVISEKRKRFLSYVLSPLYSQRNGSRKWSHFLISAGTWVLKPYLLILLLKEHLSLLSLWCLIWAERSKLETILLMLLGAQCYANSWWRNLPSMVICKTIQGKNQRLVLILASNNSSLILENSSRLKETGKMPIVQSHSSDEPSTLCQQGPWAVLP